MGDPKKIRKKYETPTHPWQKERIEEEKKLINEYGLKNKKEIWRMATILKKFKDQVKALASRIDEQSKLEEKQLINHLLSLGLIKQEEPLGNVLALNVRNVLERRLQTILVRKELAKSMKQARQFITHGHVIVDKKKITFPTYIVKLKEESLIEFVPASTLSKEDHPERIIKEVSKDKIEKKKGAKKEEASPPTFAPEEIKEIEEKGAVEKKEVKQQKSAKSSFVGSSTNQDLLKSEISGGSSGTKEEKKKETKAKPEEVKKQEEEKNKK